MLLDTLGAGDPISCVSGSHHFVAPMIPGKLTAACKPLLLSAGRAPCTSGSASQTTRTAPQLRRCICCWDMCDYPHASLPKSKSLRKHHAPVSSHRVPCKRAGCRMLVHEPDLDAA